MIKKQQPMKARGVRLDDERWNFIEKEAALDKTGRMKPSDIVRFAIDFYQEHKNKIRKK